MDFPAPSGAAGGQTLKGRLSARCYGEEGRFELYDDDGETYKYEQGENCRALLRCSGPLPGCPLILLPATTTLL
jgi:hypothetical protein